MDASPTDRKKAVILDRDGTLIDVVRDEETGLIHSAFHPAQLRLLPGVVTGLHMLRDAGYALAIATNQPGPAKGHFSRDAVERTNAALSDMLAAEGIAFVEVASCMHHPVGGAGGDPHLVGPCDCRKPKPGLLERLIARHGFDRSATWMIGDAVSDIEAARGARVRAGLIFASNRCELCPLRPDIGVTARQPTPDVSGSDLTILARAILEIDRAAGT